MMDLAPEELRKEYHTTLANMAGLLAAYFYNIINSDTATVDEKETAEITLRAAMALAAAAGISDEEVVEAVFQSKNN